MIIGEEFLAVTGEQLARLSDDEFEDLIDGVLEFDYFEEMRNSLHCLIDPEEALARFGVTPPGKSIEKSLRLKRLLRQAQEGIHGVLERIEGEQ